MSHATLTLFRVTLWAVEVRDRDGRSRHLEEPAARADFEQTPAWLEYTRKMDAQRDRREEFERSARVERDVQVRRDTGGILKSRVKVDFVWFGDDRHEVKAGSGDSFVRRHALEVHPELVEVPDPFDRWYAARRQRYLAWRAVLITGSCTEPVALGLDPEPPTAEAGFPTETAMRELDRLAEKGWRLLHVSEDHGPPDPPRWATGQVTRVRYLLTRP